MFNKKKMETDLLYSEIERLKRENYKLTITVGAYKEKESEIEKLRDTYKNLVEETKRLRDIAKEELESYRDLFSEYQGYLNNLK